MRSGTSVTTLKCVRDEGESDAQLTYHFSIQGQFEFGRSAERKVKIAPSDRNKILELFDGRYGLGGGRGTGQTLSAQELTDVGRRIFETFFDSDAMADPGRVGHTFEQALSSIECHYLKIETNDPEIPWELALLPGESGESLGVRYATTTRIEAPVGLLHHLTEQLQAQELASTPEPTYDDQDRPLKILFVVDPSLDASVVARYALHDIGESARGELGQILAVLEARGLSKPDLLEGREADFTGLAYKVSRNSYDILHFIGHSIFHPTDPVQRGLALADGLLTPKKIAEMFHDKCPTVVFANSCVSGRTPVPIQHENDQRVGVAQATSLFAGFCEAGVKAYIGTLWSPNTETAASFAVDFYEHLLGDCTVGQALREARRLGAR